MTSRLPQAIDAEVVICGLGPVGQLLALALGEFGVSVVAVEQAREPYDLPRAAVIDDEVLRIFQSVGLDAEVLADAQPHARVSFLDAGGRAFEVLRTARGDLGHPPLVSIHQPSMERTMVRALRGRGRARLQWGRRVEVVDQDAYGVTVWSRPVSGGCSEPLRGRYLVACDGARSAVRARLGIAFSGSTFAQRWLVVDTRVDPPLARAPHPHFAGDLARPTVCLPMSPGRHRWEFMLAPGEAEAPLLERARIRELIAPWTVGEAVEIERAIVYTFHSRTAARWRAGRILLAGDAAHVMPPFVGQGFSSGARDAANLAWKLDAVLHGAPSRLLDTYEAERRRHVAAMQHFAMRWGAVVQTTRPGVGRLRDRTLALLDRSGGLAWLRGQAKPLPTYRAGAFARRPARLPFARTVGALFPQPIVGAERLDDRLGPGWSAVSAAPALAARLHAAGVRAVVLGGDPWLTGRGAAWAILRPDRYVFDCGRVDEVGRGLAALRALVGPGLRSTPERPLAAVAA